jgi:hypothetical protein
MIEKMKHVEGRHIPPLHSALLDFFPNTSCDAKC